MQCCNHVCGGAGWRHHDDPARIFDVNAALLECRHVGQLGDTLCSGHAQCAHLASLDIAFGRRDAVDHDLDLTGQQVLRGGAGAFVGNMHHINARSLLEQFSQEMVGAAVAGRAVVQLVGVLPCVVDKLAGGLARHTRIDDEHRRELANQRHRNEVLHRVKWQFHAQRRRKRVAAAGGHQQGVAVGCGAGHLFGSNDAVGSRLVIRHHRLLQLHTQFFAHQTRSDVSATARRKRNDHPDLAVRE